MTKMTGFGTLVLWPQDTGNRRRDMRIPTGSMVIAEPSHGPGSLCMVKDVGEGGLCVEWHDAPVDLDDKVKLVFEKREGDTVQNVEVESLVKWYSPKYVGLAFTASSSTDKFLCRSAQQEQQPGPTQGHRSVAPSIRNRSGPGSPAKRKAGGPGR